MANMQPPRPVDPRFVRAQTPHGIAYRGPYGLVVLVSTDVHRGGRVWHHVSASLATGQPTNYQMAVVRAAFLTGLADVEEDNMPGLAIQARHLWAPVAPRT